MSEAPVEDVRTSTDAVSAGAPTVLVDVGIPTRGAAPYLREAIESVRAQTFQGWRLTISQNGEGAGRTVVEPYLEDPRISFTETGADLPMGANFTRLVRAATAPYVALLHDDDRWLPHFLEHHVSFLEEHPECGLVFSPALAIDDDGRAIGPLPLKLTPGVHGPDEIWPILYRANVVGVASVLVRRGAYASVGDEYDSSIRFNDHEMWLRIAAKFPIGVLAVREASYRIHARQASALERLQQGAKRLELLDAVDARLAAGEATPPIPRRVRTLARAEVELCCALDAVELGDRRNALAHLGRSLRTHPQLVLRPSATTRIGAVTLGLALGRPGRAIVTALRRRRSATGGARRIAHG